MPSMCPPACPAEPLTMCMGISGLDHSRHLSQELWNITQSRTEHRLCCSAELSSGLQAAAQTVTDTRLALVESRTLAGRAMSAWLLPAVRQRVPAARGTLSIPLLSSCRLQHSAGMQ